MDDLPPQFAIPGEGFEDKEGRIWSVCGPPSETEFFPFCMYQNGKSTQVNLNLAKGDLVNSFLDDGQTFKIITYRHHVFLDPNRAGKFEEITQKDFTRGNFDLNSSFCKETGQYKFACLEFGIGPSTSQLVLKKLWRWSQDHEMEEVFIPSNQEFAYSGQKNWEIDATGRLIILFSVGAYRLDGDHWTEIFSHKDLSRRLKIENAKFKEIQYDHVNDRLWFIDPNNDVWLEENLSLRTK